MHALVRARTHTRIPWWSHTDIDCPSHLPRWTPAVGAALPVIEGRRRARASSLTLNRSYTSRLTCVADTYTACSRVTICLVHVRARLKRACFTTPTRFSPCLGRKICALRDIQTLPFTSALHVACRTLAVARKSKWMCGSAPMMSPCECPEGMRTFGIESTTPPIAT